MIETIVTALAGGGTGLIGSLVGRVAGYFEKRQELKQLELQMQHEINMKKIDIEDRREQRQSEERVTETKESTSALLGSYQHDTGYGSSYLRAIRPLLTVGLIGCTMYIYHSLGDGTVGRDEISAQIVYLTGVAVAWWFADRSGKGKK